MKKVISSIILLLSFVACDDGFDYPLSDTVEHFIRKEYKGADIRDLEYTDNGLLEVEIKHDSFIKDVYFKNDEWVYTTWNVSKRNLPNAVINTLESEYQQYNIDSIDFIESPGTEYYKIELEENGFEKTIRITPTGAIL